MRKVLFILLIVNGLAFELLQKDVLRYAAVRDLRVRRNVETLELTTDAFEERGTATPGSSEDNEQLSAIHMSVEIAQDLFLGGMAEKFTEAEGRHED